MKKIREHLLYSIVIGTGLVLFIATIGLQFVILSQQTQPATATQPVLDQPEKEADSLIARVANDLTKVIQSRSRAVVQEDTMAVGQSHLGVEDADRVAPQIDDTVPPKTRRVTAIPIPTSLPPADLRVGVTDRGLNCGFYTEIVATILDEEYGVTVETVSFENSDALFSALAESEKESGKLSTDRTYSTIDLTFCFIDPTDRAYMQRYVGYMNIIGNAYWQNATYKLQIMANTSIITPLKAITAQENSCLYTFLQNLTISERHPQTQDATAWIEANQEQIHSWTNCKS